MQYHAAETNPYLSERADPRPAASPSYLTRPEPPSYVQENLYEPGHDPSKLQAQPWNQELDKLSRSSSVSSNAGGEAEEDDAAILDEALDFARHRDAPPPPAYMPRLMKPVAIPQVSPKMGSPFLRAYSEVLSAHSIRLEEFVQFVDNFNILVTGSPPLAALNTVGNALRFVPNHWAQLAGGITQVVSGVATYAVIKTRCARFVKCSNTEFFEPRGLKVQVKSTEDMAKICGVSLQDVMVQPLRPDDDIAGLGPLTRRLKAVEGPVAPLSLNVPPPAEQTQILARLSQKQSEATRKKMEKKTLKGRQKALEKIPGGEGKATKNERKKNKELAKLEEEIAKVEAKAAKEMQKAMKEKPGKRDEKMDKVERERQKELAKIQEEQEKVSRKTDKESRKGQKNYQKDDKEIKASKKGLWILVRNVDEARADEAEEQRRKAESPFALLPLSRSTS